jgi:hypothetical protein
MEKSAWERSTGAFAERGRNLLLRQLRQRGYDVSHAFEPDHLLQPTGYHQSDHGQQEQAGVRTVTGRERKQARRLDIQPRHTGHDQRQQEQQTPPPDSSTRLVPRYGPRVARRLCVRWPALWPPVHLLCLTQYSPSWRGLLCRSPMQVLRFAGFLRWTHQTVLRGVTAIDAALLGNDVYRRNAV